MTRLGCDLNLGEIAEHGFFAREALPEGATGGTWRRSAEAFGGRGDQR
jgi:hypothetical protein